MNYPEVMDERGTLHWAQTRSIARFGDGELRLATGGSAVSQVANVDLRAELQQILRGTASKHCLTCIPRIGPTRPNWARTWATYTAPGIVRQLGHQAYGSAFITRPDNAPEIDTPDYWEAVRNLWRGRPVLLIAGTDKSLRAEDLFGADRITVLTVPNRDAYDVIRDAEGATLDWHAQAHHKGQHPVVLMCAGAMATVLAARVSLHGVHALDLGHIGMFMRSAGAYNFHPTALASDQYRKVLRDTHKKNSWGASGKSHALAVADFALVTMSSSLLDYGCGRGTLKSALAACAPHLKVQEYDPGVPEKAHMPKPVDMVACTDVMEHIESDKIEAVLAHIFALAGKAAYFNIALKPARQILTDGRNAHLSLLPPERWLKLITKSGWTVQTHVVAKGLTVWCAK